jgi:DNA-binding GntR family transcriptional regulator
VKTGYLTVATDLEQRIKRGEWQSGQQIPAIPKLQEQYSVRSLNVIRRAQAVLVEKGLLRVEQGRGAFVASLGESTPLELLAELESASQQLRAAIYDWTGVTVRLVATLAKTTTQ